jgi:hypothetical protein
MPHLKVSELTIEIVWRHANTSAAVRRRLAGEDSNRPMPVDLNARYLHTGGKHRFRGPSQIGLLEGGRTPHKTPQSI